MGHYISHIPQFMTSEGQMCVHEHSVTLSYVTLCDPMDVACQSPLSMEFFRQEYWSGVTFPSPGDLPDQGSNPCFLHLLL